VTLAIIIPTRNGGNNLARLLDSINNQKCEIKRRIIIDSESTDNTVEIARKYHWEILQIKKKDFDHGATRQKALDFAADTDIVVFMTQDAVLVDDSSIATLIECFKDDNVCATYGRQIPHSHAKPLGAHARLFNYTEKSRDQTFEGISQFGIKTAFISNSFSAYRCFALQEIGGFPTGVILGEDTYVAAKLILKGYQVFYNSDAKVYHSHDYTLLQEFQRYFDIGVFHSRESWLREKFGNAEGEGIRFIRSELTYLIKTGNIHLIPSSITRTIFKFIGYRLGVLENLFSNKLKLIFSMNKTYWIK